MSKPAVEGKRISAYGVDPSTLIIVGLDTDDGPDHALYDERIKLPVNEAMVRNIMLQGVIEPIIGTKNGEKVLVVAGRQRVRAAREANIRLEKAGSEVMTIPVMLSRGSDENLFGVMISENEIRSDDVLTTKLPKLEKLLAFGKTEQEAADIFGVTTQTIKNWLSLIAASPDVKKAVSKGSISATAGVTIAKLPREDQPKALEVAVSNGGGSTHVAQQFVRTRRQNAQNGTEEDTIIPPSKRILRKLIETGEIQKVEAEPYQIIEWVLGSIPARRVKGLTEVLRRLEKEES